jgi:hypothetical protein
MHVRAECSVGLWQEFLGGWMPTSFSGQYCDGARKRWSAIKQSGVSPLNGHGIGSGGSTCPDSPADGVIAGGSIGGGAARSTRGGTAVAGGSAQAAQEFQRTIPCAIVIVGNTLGVPSNYANQKGVFTAVKTAPSAGKGPAWYCWVF